ncbi:MAG TPA: hypothetical protein VEO54_07920 [Thermoanaerobaculia bacterium]|nr:hypothetical protein [Thermoanaerobaculia bacterium]
MRWRQRKRATNFDYLAVSQICFTCSASCDSRARRQVVRNRTWALTCLAAAVFVLLRRPTPGGLVIALLLFCAAFLLMMRMRAATRL